ncbi:PREDICTED: uncharacterized protein LOC106811067 [Priapulus caudatus]|uniref:Uncharacterized protein LOC106811067 n=1 Tax=Priapulus caudatus TaxID=37621 RepID=A0ABM1ED11_PRICU|nr:PREDICTED: uncharacterized protein LOC106811067 [Priapulus caudatus]
MQFHAKHGSAIVLVDGNTRAKRTHGFCNAVTFSSRPLEVGEFMSLDVTKTTLWSGAVRLGVTIRKPDTLEWLPRYAVPDLTSRPGFWVKSVREQWLSDGSRITFVVTDDGNLQLFVNNVHKSTLLFGLPVHQRLWAVIDIYGNTDSVRIIGKDEAPVEIVSRGREAMRVFQHASASGTTPVHRTRIMIVGPHRVGKTRLKSAMLGHRDNTGALSTDEIDMSASCEVLLDDGAAVWLSHSKDQHPLPPANGVTKKSVNEQEEGQDEDYSRAVATNVVQELIALKRQKEEEKRQRLGDSEFSIDSEEEKQFQIDDYNRFESSRWDQDKTEKEGIGIKADMLRELPDRVVEIVEEMLQEGNKDSNKLLNVDDNRQESDCILPQLSKKLLLKIWDFSGEAIHYTIQQVFLSARAVYLVVFNLTCDLDKPAVVPTRRHVNGEEILGEEASELSNLDALCFWLHAIHVSASRADAARAAAAAEAYSPPAIIVGTHRRQLADTEVARCNLVEQKFKRIREQIRDKPYAKHVINTFFDIDICDEIDDLMISKLKSRIVDVAIKEPYMGEQIPLKWLKFEREVTRLVNQGVNYCSLHQMREIVQEEEIALEEDLATMLNFYHDLGVVVYVGGVGAIDDCLRNTVILQPQWLLDVFRRVITVTDLNDQWPHFMDSWGKLEREGIIEDRLLDHMWADIIEQKSALIGFMERFDLLCERQQPTNLMDEEEKDWVKSYYVPCRLQQCPDTNGLTTAGKHDAIFYLDFNGFMPDGIFHRLLIRAVRWSQENGGREPKLYYRVARFYVNDEHDFVLEMSSLHYSRIKVLVLRVAVLDDEEEQDMEVGTDNLPPPKPHACAEVRRFLELALQDLKKVWMWRISYRTMVQCGCSRECALHRRAACTEQSCVHFLPLDDCLSNKVVSCDHRRIKTAPFRKIFPSPTPFVKDGPVIEAISKAVIAQQARNTESVVTDLPHWVRGAAKMLNAATPGADWSALAKKLGYRKEKVRDFEDDINPGLALIVDWVHRGGNNVACADVQPAQVFLSYSWDVQDQVKVLRTRLEQAGFTCWMDLGQMGGGDYLYSKIELAIRDAKMVVCCITPKYVSSYMCIKEANLADVLRKPTIPVMFKKTQWPPPNGLALVFPHLLYIDLFGLGGHGGSGIHADFEARMAEVIYQVAQYSQPALPRKHLAGYKPVHFELQEKMNVFNVEAATFVRDSVTTASVHGEGDIHGTGRTLTPVTVGAGIPVANVQRCTVCAIL